MVKYIKILIDITTNKRTLTILKGESLCLPIFRKIDIKNSMEEDQHRGYKKECGVNYIKR
ncbi:hypothetical protein CFE53_03425 [Methanofervidicoccus sp. A16]|nr:hypothetical protein CFE53_03425 [Methanofervidicoccus sp. A16]